MKTKKILILFSLLFVFSGICGLYLYGSLIANRNINIRQIDITSNINLKIAYFSDVNLYEFLNEKDFSNIIEKIKSQDPDVVLFGGNLINNKINKELSQDQIAYLIKELKSISAPYGMFAVYGEYESKFDYYQSTTSYILQKSQFELLNDQHTKIYKDDNYINLVGLFQKGQIATDNQQVISFSHNPDLINTQNCNVMLAGKVLGGQINIPFFNNSFFKDIKYHKQTQTINNCQLFISNGVGTKKIDFRLFAPANIIILNLKPDSKK